MRVDLSRLSLKQGTGNEERGTGKHDKLSPRRKTNAVGVYRWCEQTSIILKSVYTSVNPNVII